MKNTFEVKWSGSYPSKCVGHWSLFKNGVDISDKIPEDKSTENMNTFGTYHNIYFSPDFEECEEIYDDGLELHDWIDKNRYWLDKFCESEDDYSEVFDEFQMNDWRCGECGGCL